MVFLCQMKYEPYESVTFRLGCLSSSRLRLKSDKQKIEPTVHILISNTPVFLRRAGNFFGNAVYDLESGDEISHRISETHVSGVSLIDDDRDNEDSKNAKKPTTKQTNSNKQRLKPSNVHYEDQNRDMFMEQAPVIKKEKRILTMMFKLQGERACVGKGHSTARETSPHRPRLI